MSIEQMVAVPIQEFISGSKLPVDVFVKLSETKFVLLVRAGDPVQLSRLTEYANKQVEHLYIRKEEYSKYTKQNMAIAGIALTKSELEQKKKLNLVSAAMSSVFQEFEVVGIRQETLNLSKKILLSTVDLIESKPILSELLESLGRLSSELLAHSIGVSLISIAIGEAMEWTQSSTLEKLALGGLFHEIGMRQLPKHLVTKPFALYEYEEVQLYESHPHRGAQILKSIGFIPDDVVAIVYEHHENQAGQGFPRRLKHLRIHPLTRVISVADSFCDQVLKGMNNPQPRNSIDSMIYMNEQLGPLFSKDVLKALDKFVYQVGKEKKSA